MNPTRRHLWFLYVAAVVTPAPGLMLFLGEDGESLLGMYLLAAALLVLAITATVAFMQRKKTDLLIGIFMLLYILPFLFLASYTCWVAGFEGKCPVFG